MRMVAIAHSAAAAEATCSNIDAGCQWFELKADTPWEASATGTQKEVELLRLASADRLPIRRTLAAAHARSRRPLESRRRAVFGWQAALRFAVGKLVG